MSKLGDLAKKLIDKMDAGVAVIESKLKEKGLKLLEKYKNLKLLPKIIVAIAVVLVVLTLVKALVLKVAAMLCCS